MLTTILIFIYIDGVPEGQHDDEERHEKHRHILHHHVDAQDDGAEVLRCDSNLNKNLI